MLIEKATDYLPALSHDPGYFEANYMLWDFFESIRNQIWDSVTNYLGKN